MTITEQVAISGTDPSNPRCAQDIVARLEQIERDTLAMWREAKRLEHYASGIRDVLREEQGISDSGAVAWAVNVRERIQHLAVRLEQANAAAARPVHAIHDSKVNLRARFQWRPTRG